VSANLKLTLVDICFSLKKALLTARISKEKETLLKLGSKRPRLSSRIGGNTGTVKEATAIAGVMIMDD
jgi:hypothetical protein